MRHYQCDTRQHLAIDGVAADWLQTAIEKHCQQPCEHGSEHVSVADTRGGQKARRISFLRTVNWFGGLAAVLRSACEFSLSLVEYFFFSRI